MRREQNIKVVLVEPLYQINLGYIARTLKNFGIREVNLVGPRCNYKGKEAIKYSKHAADILAKAKIHKSIAAAVRGCDVVIGTTGIWYKSDSSFYNVHPISEMNKIIGGRKAALLIGRDDIGLTKEELKMCDANIFIPADDEYPVFNISHALAILLYELGREKENHLLKKFIAGKREIDGISGLFWSEIKNRPDIKNKKMVLMAFNHILTRANPTWKELNALAIGIKNKQKKKNEKK